MASGTNPDTRYCSECGRPWLLDELARFGDRLVCPVCKNSYVQKLREGVAPAAAGYQFAGFWIRFVAILLDGIILVVVGSVINAVLFGSMMPRMARIRPDTTPEEMLSVMGPMLGIFGLSFLLNTAIQCCYEAFFISRLGATPGKMALSLKVVRPDGGPISFGRAVGRYFGKFLSYMTLSIGFIIAGFDSQKRALHDMICDTRVVRVQN
jgi:uncharacterized RDD family membrane protein YckC